MSFCNSCGNAIEAGVRFCSKCGAPTAATGVATSPAPSSPASITTKNSSLNTVLIIVGTLFALFVVGIMTAVFVARRIAVHTHVDRNGDNVQVETPFGKVESTTDPGDVYRELGTAVYPGSRMDKGNASRADIAGAHTISAQFTTNDPAGKVAAYYKKTFPDASVSVLSDGQSTIVSTANQKLVTVTVNPDGEKSQIIITSVSGKRSHDDSSSD